MLTKFSKQFTALSKLEKTFSMAPQTKVPCFAAKDNKGKLERCEFEPTPLNAGDIGAFSVQGCADCMKVELGSSAFLAVLASSL